MGLLLMAIAVLGGAELLIAVKAAVWLGVNLLVHPVIVSGSVDLELREPT